MNPDPNCRLCRGTGKAYPEHLQGGRVALDTVPGYDPRVPCVCTKPKMTNTAHDRLTRMCDRMTNTFDQHEEHRDGDKCIVFLDDGNMGGLVIHGYEDSTEALTDLLLHLKAMFEAHGKTLDLMFLGEDGVNRA